MSRRSAPISARLCCPKPERPYGGIRRYGGTDVARVKFVKSAQRLGFSLDEVAGLLRLEDGTHCDEASHIAEYKLQEIRAKLADLARLESVLCQLVCACRARKGKVSCPPIASLQGGTSLATATPGRRERRSPPVECATEHGRAGKNPRSTAAKPCRLSLTAVTVAARPGLRKCNPGVSVRCAWPSQNAAADDHDNCRHPDQPRRDSVPHLHCVFRLARRSRSTGREHVP